MWKEGSFLEWSNSSIPFYKQVMEFWCIFKGPSSHAFHYLRWDDDVVFKNQARGETKTPKRFINDTIRNDFHRKFLQKYMK